MRCKNYILIVSLFIFSSFMSAQDRASKSVERNSEIKQTTKFDEFSDISEKEFAPKLREFFRILRKNNSFQGYVVFYNSFNATPFKQTKFFANRKTQTYSSYLTCLCSDSLRITYILGGLREKMTTELWLIPSGGNPPQIINTGELIKDERYKLELLSAKQLDFNLERLDFNSETSREETEEVDYENEIESMLEDSAKDLSEVLSRDKTWRAVLIYYADKDERDIKELQQMIEVSLKPFVETSKLDLSRVKSIFGGYRTIPEIETWIVNKNGIEPEPMPDEKFEAEN